MKRLLTRVAIIGVAMAGLWAGPAWAAEENEQRYDAATLKKALQDVGYEIKEVNAEVGKEKYEIQVKRPDFNVPMGVEISPSKRYIWLTANLGLAPDATKEPATRFEALLKANGKIQPCQFYITSKGNLMIAMPVENRGMQNSHLRFAIDKLADETSNQAGVWNIKPSTP